MFNKRIPFVLSLSKYARAAMPVTPPTGSPLMSTAGGTAPVMAREIECGEMKE